MKALLTAVFLSLSVSLSATSYYVSNSGNDGNDGKTEATAWKSISKVNSQTFSPGDNILFKRGEIWTTTKGLRISASGTSGNQITFGAYGEGEKPILNGKSEVAGWNTESNWTNSSGNIWYITRTTDVYRIWANGKEEKRCQTTNVSSATKWRWDSGTSRLYFYSEGNPATTLTKLESINVSVIVEMGGRNYITLDNLDLQGSHTSIEISGNGWIINSCNIGRDGSAYGVFIYGSSLCKDGVISNCTFDTNDHIVDNYIWNNTEDAISFYKIGVDNWQIYNNTFTDWSHGAYVVNITDVTKQFTNTRFFNNTITSKDIDFGKAINMDVSLGCTTSGNEVYNNYIYKTTISSQIQVKGLKFYNNIIDEVHSFNSVSGSGSGIKIQNYAGDGRSMEFYNNTIVNCQEAGLFFSDSGHNVSSPEDNVFINNLLVNNGGTNGYQIFISDTDGTAANEIGGNIYRNNLLYKSGVTDLVYYGPSTTNNYPHTIAEFDSENGTAEDVISGTTTGDPLLVDISNPDFLSRNYHLSSGSSAIGAGINVGLITDYSGNTWKSTPSIGAFEYDGTTPSTPSAPVYVSSVIENATPGRLDMTYNLTLANVVPAASSFTVMVNSTARTVSSVTVSATKVQLNLASAVVYGDVVTVSYTAPATNPLQTSAGGKAVSIANKAVTNNVGAINPVYVSSVVENDTPSRIEMTYNMTLTDVAPSASAFTVMINSASRTVSSVIVSGTKIYLGLASPVAFGDVVTVAYTKPATNYLKTTSGGQAATLSAQTVVNNVVNPPAGPEYLSSVVENATPTIVEVSFDQQLANVIPSASSFIVKVNSVAVTVNSVSISGTSLRLSISKTIYAGDIVTVSYVVPEQNAVQIASGAEAAALSNETVTNNSELVVVKNPVRTRLLTAYPNPVTDYVTIRIAGSFTELNTIRFFNMSGTLCLEVKPDPGLNEITIPVNLKAGLYLVQLTSGKTTVFALKISVKK